MADWQYVDKSIRQTRGFMVREMQDMLAYTEALNAKTHRRLRELYILVGLQAIYIAFLAVAVSVLATCSPSP